MKKLEIDKRRLRILQSINKSIAKENDEHKKNIEIFENVLGIKALPMLQDEALTEIVAELGNTPLAEPKLYKMIVAGEPMAILEHIKGLEGNANLDFEEMDAMEVSRFIAAIRFRVASFTDEDGNRKSTKNTENIKTLNFKQVQEMKKLFIDFDAEKIEKTGLGFSGLNIEKLSEWEKDLVRSDIQAQVMDVNKTMLGGF